MKLVLTVFWVGMSIFTSSAIAGIYKWVDGNGEVHYSDVPFENESAYEVDVDTRGTSIGNKSARERELNAIKGINRKNRNNMSRTKTFSNNDESARKKIETNNYACESAKKRLDDLKKIMRGGYSSSQSNYFRSRKRDLSEKERQACRS